MKRWVTRVLSVLFSITVSASPSYADVFFIRAGKIVDTVNGRVLEDRLIKIVDDRIETVEPYSDPGDAEIVDWSEYTVLPGLIDMHTHLLGDIQGHIFDPLATSGAEDVLIGVNNGRKTLKAGFTTVRDVGSWRAFTDVALRNAINAGFVEGPRMAVSGGYFTIPGGGGAITGLTDDIELPKDYAAGVVYGADDARLKARNFIQHDVDFLKMIATGAVLTVGTDPGMPELSEAEMRAIVEEASQYGKFVTAHAHGAEGAKMAIRAGVRSIEHGSLLDDDALSLMKKRGVWLVADIYNGDYIDEIGNRDGWPLETLEKNRDTTDQQRDVFRKAVKMGVKIAYGTDSGVYPHGDNAKQMPYMVKYGMTPMQAIQSATIEGARLLGWENEVGSISPGHYADLIAIDGDPTQNVDDLVHLQFVMKGGKLID